MAKKALVFVGSMTRKTPYFETADGEGVSVLMLDEDNGQLARRHIVQGTDNPAFISLHRERGMLFATSEVYGWNEGIVTAYRFDPRDGALSYVNKQVTLGSITAHNSIDRSGRHLFTTNYSHEKWDGHYQEDTPRQAVAVFPIEESGRLGAAICSVAHHGSGPVPHRQAEPHPHCAMASPDNRFVLVTDLGIDAVISYRFAGGQLTRSSALSTAPGAGPRHLKFAPDGRSVYVINELDSTMAHLIYDDQTGELSQRQIISTLPEGFSGANRCSDLQLSSDGRFLYGANRGHDSLVVFRIDPGSGALELVGHTPCGGRTPRNFGLSPTGSYALVANQNGHNVAVFRRDPEKGTLQQIGALDVGTPMVVAMVPA